MKKKVKSLCAHYDETAVHDETQTYYFDGKNKNITFPHTHKNTMKKKAEK